MRWSRSNIGLEPHSPNPIIWAEIHSQPKPITQFSRWHSFHRRFKTTTKQSPFHFTGFHASKRLLSFPLLYSTNRRGFSRLSSNSSVVSKVCYLVTTVNWTPFLHYAKFLINCLLGFGFAYLHLNVRPWNLSQFRGARLFN